ncbi:PREDICTED: T-lymphocyte surface antigen Ly-9-like [Elephantulus edwardii]|uniref:T-lymphocyte surface antigen Ly-9-like n=1 Tax=Elephantulus edwardii TaxID=28737 RepID=UPI0003F0A8A8|nr:PREDICTED: T-lymphocyte surface antigen Ly-9-like [Elephantulus edwardii]
MCLHSSNSYQLSMKQVSVLVDVMGLSPLWFLLLLGLFMGPGASSEDSARMVITGTLGASVTLPLQWPPGQQVESVSWMTRTVSVAIAEVTLREAGGLDIFHQSETRYQGRLHVVGPGHSLKISNLSREDAGYYRARINLRRPLNTHIREYILQVYEQLGQPRVTLSSRMGENQHCTFILTCVAESRGDPVTYSWAPLGPWTVVSHGGSVLSVSLRPGHHALMFTCTVKNPVSSSSSLPVSLPDFCAEKLQEPNITTSSQIMNNETCFITLVCSLDQAGEDVEYSWDPYDQGTVVSHGGTTLRTSWKSGDSHSYRCTVKNPVSQRSRSILARPLCSASFLPCSLRKEFLLCLILGTLEMK